MCLRFARILTPPMGPSTAFDLTADRKLICFDERTNRLLEMDANGDERPDGSFLVHSDFGCDHYYWSQIVCSDAHPDILLCLLKHHHTKMFYLVTLQLSRDQGVGVAMYKMRTKIRSIGYHVGVQKLSEDGHCMFSFCNYGERLQSVLLDATVTGDGHISARLLCVGKRRFGMELKKPDIAINKHRRQGSLTGLQTQYMTKLPRNDLHAPVFIQGKALFVDKTDTNRCIVVETAPEPKYGLKAAVKARVNRYRQRQREREKLSLTETEIRSFLGEQRPPNGQSVWSNAVVVDSERLLYFVKPNADELGQFWTVDFGTKEWHVMETAVAEDDYHEPCRNLVLRYNGRTGSLVLRGNCDCDRSRHFVVFEMPPTVPRKTVEVPLRPMLESDTTLPPRSNTL